MCKKSDPSELGVLDVRARLLILGHGEIAIEVLDLFPAMR
jgi:hypothetical protein